MSDFDFSPVNALVGAVGSVASGFMNAMRQDSQNAWNYKMWKEQMAYNTPANQVARLRAAGLNPALAMQNGSIDSGSMSSLPEGTAPSTYDFSPVSQGMQNDMALSLQKRMNDAEIDNKHALTENQRIKNMYENQRQLSELFKLLTEGNLNQENQHLVQKQINRLDKELEWYDRDMESQISLRNSQSVVADAQKDYQTIINGFAPQIQAQTLKNLQKQGAAIDAAARKDDAEAVLAAANKFLTDLRAKGVQIDNDIAESIIDARIDEAYAKADEQYWRSQREGKSFTLGRVGDYLPSGSSDQNVWKYDPPSSRRPSVRKQSKRSKLNPKRISVIE